MSVTEIPYDEDLHAAVDQAGENAHVHLNRYVNAPLMIDAMSRQIHAGDIITWRSEVWRKTIFCPP